jgi:hypothetical protein
MKQDRPRRLASLTLVSLLVACTSRSPSEAPEVSSQAGAPTSAPVASSASASAAAAAPTSAASPTPAGPLGGGPLLVYQLDDMLADKAKTESVFTFDLGTGERTKIGSIRRGKEDGCCPEVVRLSTDRTRAFLWAGRYRASVDVAARAVTPAPKRLVTFVNDGSSSGDRLAWVDWETGTAETIVIADLKGHELDRLALPTGAWQTTLAWSPDDKSFAVATRRPIATAMAGLGGTILCCSVDHGVTANHLLIVPVDGSAIRDLLDDAAAVAQDESQPIPTPPPGETTIGARKAERSFAPPVWSPDGRTILLTSTFCEGASSYHHAGACHGSLSLVDTYSGAQTALMNDFGTIGGVDWSPDGRKVAFISGSEGQDRLYVVDRDGHNLRALRYASGGLVDWSPDGAWIAFWQWGTEGPEERDRSDVWAMPLVGGVPLLVAEHATAGW